MDLLTDVMRSVSMRDAKECHLTLRSPWGVHVGALDRSGFVAVRSGRAVLSVKGASIPLEAGDLCILLEPGIALLGDGSGVVTAECPKGACSTLACPNGAEETSAIVGSFELVDRLAHPFLAQLPPVLHLTHKETGPRIEATLSLLEEEAADLGMGSSLSIARLFELVLIQTLRAYLERRCVVCEHTGASWLRAVTDPELYPALEAVHGEPLHPWTVEGLARRVGLSRTAFATRFTEAMGHSPMRYVTRWRLHLAADALKQQATLSRAAEVAGYRSDASFAKAFKRELGLSPGKFRSRV